MKPDGVPNAAKPPAPNVANERRPAVHPIEAARAAGLTTLTQSQFVMSLAAGPKTNGEIAERLELTPSAVSLIAGKLRGAFFIEPVEQRDLPGMSDGRQRPYRLTKKGRILALSLTYAPLACFQSPTATTAAP
jgi:DNA-binding MarR family transcriptional regulator